MSGGKEEHTKADPVPSVLEEGRFGEPADPRNNADLEWAFKDHSLTLRLVRLAPPIIRRKAFSLSHGIASSLRHEADTGTGFQMLAVAFGLGALGYFSLPREPLLVALLLALAATIFLAAKTYGSRTGNLMLVAAFVFGGMSAGKIRTVQLDTVMIERPVTTRIEGIVMNREVRAKGRIRYTIRVLRLEKKMRSRPNIVRASAAAKYPPIEIGNGIKGLVRLQPPSGPAYPGSYGFAFHSWFKSIGGSGFFLGPVNNVAAQLELPLTDKASILIASMRANLATRIRGALDGEAGSLAAALIVGDRSGISDDTTEALRRSGLAHILAISGLHMALVTATLIFVIRGILALMPGLVLHYPVRKWAAAAAMVAASIYLVISGASIATQRAWIMIMVMLIAILADRRALTMRNVALAVLFILAWRPESIVSPGFQMSFAAVAALIAVYERWSRYRRGRPYRQSGNRLNGVISNGLKALVGLAVTSIVAGLATGLFAAYHFHRVAPLGLLANLAAMPIVSLAVMPMALAAMLVMPFGLDVYPLWLMGLAIDGVIGVASYVMELGPAGNTGFIPLASLLLGSLALVLVTQLKSPLRLAGLPVLVLAAVLYSERQIPQIMITESGRSVGIIGENGDLVLLKPRREKFVTSIWKKAFAPGQIAQEKINKGSLSNQNPYRCDQLGCTAVVRGNTVLAIVKRPQAFEEDCLRADIIVTQVKAPDWCSGPALIIGPDRLREFGSHTITLRSNGSFKVAQAHSGPYRPWNRNRR